MGKQDVVKHSKPQGHRDRARDLQCQPTLSFSNPVAAEERMKRTEVEVRMAVVTASCNVPFAFHDQLSPAIRTYFPDSKRATKYHSASTKAMCMLNLAIASSLKKDLVENMKLHPFSVSMDSSNDTGLSKTNPSTIAISDINRGQIVTKFLNMCTTSSATAATISGTMDKTLARLLESTNPWTMRTSVGVNNTFVNIGTRNSLQTGIVQRNDAVYFNGCHCHIVHNAASKAGSAFAKHCRGFDPEEFAADLYYWFDKSINTCRKNEL